MEAAEYSETFVNLRHPMQHHIADEGHLRTLCCATIKLHMNKTGSVRITNIVTRSHIVYTSSVILTA
jgi:hypothetical protein